MQDHDDPEASYRRGFQQGAKAALAAAESAANGRARYSELKHWAEIRLFEWRYQEDTQNRQVRPPAPPS